MEEISRRVDEREEQIEAVKRMFVQKLKEIEEGMVEVSLDMGETEAVQADVSKRMQQRVQT